MDIGPTWNGRDFEIDGVPVSFGCEAGEIEIRECMVGQQIVGFRVNDAGTVASIRLADGSHVAFQGISAQGQDDLIGLMWTAEELAAAAAAGELL